MTPGAEMLAALAAGALPFLSPCVLPLVPGYIAFISGVSLEEMEGAVNRGRTLAKASLASLCFGAGFTVIFIVLGATATLVGKFLFARLPLIPPRPVPCPELVAGARPRPQPAGRGSRCHIPRNGSRCRASG